MNCPINDKKECNVCLKNIVMYQVIIDVIYKALPSCIAELNTEICIVKCVSVVLNFCVQTDPTAALKRCNIHPNKLFYKSSHTT